MIHIHIRMIIEKGIHIHQLSIHKKLRISANINPRIDIPVPLVPTEYNGHFIFCRDLGLRPKLNLNG